MCGCCVCRCPRVCGCNTACCFCIKIPIDAGYIVCNLWLLINGFAFPCLSYVFWPKEYIFYGCCSICVVNAIFVSISFLNIRFKAHKAFNAVLYGIFVLYMAGGFMIITAVNVDMAGNSVLLMASLQTKFGISVHQSTTFRTLQIIQIVFYSYLFASYVYCGFILQLYEVRHDKKYRKRELLAV